MTSDGKGKAGKAGKNMKTGGEGKKGGNKPTDSRFAAMHSDPRFKRFPKKAGKVEIDSRFAGMFTDKHFQVRAAVDKRGRKMKASKSKEDMRRYYRLAEEEEESELLESKGAKGDAGEDNSTLVSGKKGKKNKEKKPEPAAEPEDEEDEDDDEDESSEEDEPEASEDERFSKSKLKLGKPMKNLDSDEDDDDDEEEEEDDDDDDDEAKQEDNEGDSSESEEGSGDEEDRAQNLYMRARGLAGPDSSDEDSDEDEDDDSEAEEDVELQDDAEAELEQMKREFGIGALAGQDIDEQDVELVEDASKRIALVDLDWAHVKAIDVLAMLRSFCGSKGRVIKVTIYPSDYGLERMKQEAVAGPQIYQASGPKEDNEDDEDEDDDDEGGEVDKARLRYYERSRLRYYYAVAEFDTVQTASRVYEACDGIEFEHSSCRLDLRFVPDEMDLTERQVRDSASNVPADYESPVFQNTSLMHSKVKLTWDADDSSRKKALQKAITEEEVKEDDIKAFLASDDSEEEEEDAEALRNRYRSLLGLGDAEAGASGRGAGTKDWGAAENANNSEDEDEDDDEDEGGKAAKKKSSKDAQGKFITADKDQEMEMEVTFNPDLEELGDRLKARKEEAKGSAKGETVWEAYLRKQKEKKARKKAGKRRDAESDDEGDEDAVDSDLDDGLYSRGGEGEPDPFFQQDDDPFSDPFFGGSGDADSKAKTAAKKAPGPKQAKSKKKGKSDGDEDEGKDNKAELEMLLMDDTALLAATRGVRPDNAPEQGMEDAAAGGKQRLSRKERIRRKKEAKLRARQYGSDDEDLGVSNAGAGFKADLQDPRFKALYSDPKFALDPTEPEFQRGTGMAEMAKEVSKLRQSKAGQAGKALVGGEAANESKAAPLIADAGSAGQDSVKAMVANLKRKAAKDKKASAGNKKRHKF